MPAGASSEMDADALRRLVCAYDWPCDLALAIIACESGGNAYAVGSAGERGLGQLHPVHAWRFQARGWSWDDAFVPERNIAVMYEVYLDNAGFGPWECLDVVS